MRPYWTAIVHKNGVPVRDERGCLVVEVHAERGLPGMTMEEFAAATSPEGVAIADLSPKVRDYCVARIDDIRKAR